jgi:hypothetical protein
VKTDGLTLGCKNQDFCTVARPRYNQPLFTRVAESASLVSRPLSRTAASRVTSRNGRDPADPGPLRNGRLPRD